MKMYDKMKFKIVLIKFKLYDLNVEDSVSIINFYLIRYEIGRNNSYYGSQRNR